MRHNLAKSTTIRRKSVKLVCPRTHFFWKEKIPALKIPISGDGTPQQFNPHHYRAQLPSPLKVIFA